MSQLTAIGIRFTEMGILSRVTPDLLLLQRYLVRSTMDGSPAGNAMFDRMVEYGEQWLKSTDLKVSDPKAYVAVIAVMKMSMYTMRDQLSRVLGVDVGELEGWSRVLLSSIEIFSQPLITPELADQARAALDGFDTPEEQQ